MSCHCVLVPLLPLLQLSPPVRLGCGSVIRQLNDAKHASIFFSSQCQPFTLHNCPLPSPPRARLAAGAAYLESI